MSNEDRAPVDVEKRVEMLERDNARLRDRLRPFIGEENPTFNTVEFLKAMRFYVLVFVVPFSTLMSLLMSLGTIYSRYVPRFEVLPHFPLIDPGGMYSGHMGVATGVIALGGLAIGGIAIGGGAIGIVAMGGGAFGIVAVGGGAVGVIAIGGGAVGYIAVGGGAYGRYVLAGDGRGKAVISRKRQDAEAIEFFTRYLPRLKKAFTGPMPVVPVEGPFERMR